MSKSTPAPPDYQGAAREQAAASRELTDVQNTANRPTINTPWGTQSWESAAGTDPATGAAVTNWTQNTTLSPDSQAALDSQLRLQSGRSQLAERQFARSGDELAAPVDFNALPQAGATPDATPFSFGPSARSYAPESVQRGLDRGGLQDVSSASKYYGDAGDAIYSQFSSRNEPLFARDRERQRTQLYNQGLKEGDAAYDDQMKTFDTGVNDARTNAAYQATIGSGQEASRMQGMDMGVRQQQFGEETTAGSFANQAAQQAFQQQLAGGAQTFSEGTNAANMANQNARNTFDQNLQRSNYQNQQRQQSIAELLQQRGWSLNEANALLTGQQVGMPQMPGFNTAQRSETPQILNATQMGYNAQMDAFNAQQAGWQGLMSGAAGLAPFAFK